MAENISATELAEIGFAAVGYPWRLVAAKMKAVREALETLKESFGQGAPPPILSYEEVCRGVGFNKCWDLEERYKYDADGLVKQPNGV